jgi:hypothetical protein
MKNYLITLVFIVVTASSVLAQTAKAPARKPPAAQTPAKSPTTQPKAKTPTSNTRTTLPRQSTPAKTPTNNATKLPAGGSTVAPSQPVRSNYSAPSQSSTPARSSSSYRASSSPRRSSSGSVFDEGTHLLNVGLGLGYSGYRASAFPIGASYEYGITPDISVGAQFDFASFSYSSSYYYGGYYSRDRYTATYFGARGSYHLNRILDLDSDTFDLYAGVGVGYRNYGGYRDRYSPVSINGFVGGRLFFSDSVGGFVELGYTGLSYSKIGVSFKF